MQSRELKAFVIVGVILLSFYAVESSYGKNTSTLGALTSHAFKLSVRTNLSHIKFQPKHKIQTIGKGSVTGNIEGFAVCTILTTAPMAKASDDKNADETDRLLQKARKKLLISFLPIIIITTAERTTFVTPAKIMIFAEKEFHVKLSAGTVYPIFEKLVRDGYVYRLANAKRLYAVTLKGKQSIECFEPDALIIISAFIRSLSDLAIRCGKIRKNFFLMSNVFLIAIT